MCGSAAFHRFEGTTSLWFRTSFCIQALSTFAISPLIRRSSVRCNVRSWSPVASASLWPVHCRWGLAKGSYVLGESVRKGSARMVQPYAVQGAGWVGCGEIWSATGKRRAYLVRHKDHSACHRYPVVGKQEFLPQHFLVRHQLLQHEYSCYGHNQHRVWRR